MNRRRAMMRKVGGDVPAGYTAVPYIKSIKAYVDTGVISTSDIRMVVKIRSWRGPAILGDWGIRVNDISIFGDENSNELISFQLVNVNNIAIVKYGSSSSYSSWDTQNVHIFDFQNGIQKKDDVIISSLSSTFEGTNSLWIGRANGFNEASCTEVYEAQLYDNGEIVRNYTPLKRNSDNKYGLYDLCGSICSLTGTPFYTSPYASYQYGDFYFE